jgi:hypothetical protein
MWSAGFSNSVQSLVMVPIVLYQAEQILCGQVAVMLFRRWARDEWMPKNAVSDTETVTDVSSSETHLDEMKTEEQVNSEKTDTKA